LDIVVIVSVVQKARKIFLYRIKPRAKSDLVGGFIFDIESMKASVLL